MATKALRVIIAPDSFKGTVTALDVARLIAEGWLDVHPNDQLTLLPQADGGEGTLDALATADRLAIRHQVGPVTGPDGRPTPGEWLELANGLALIELAQMSGLPLMSQLDPLGASTVGFGEVIAHALDAGMRRIVLGVGGSASSDGGAGAFTALGLRLTDARGELIGVGGGQLSRVASVDVGGLRAAPPDGIVVLADVQSPLLGPRGAAAVFGPQKGATDAEVELLDAALAQFARLIGGDPLVAGAGAAGGAAYGFAALWGASIESGADFVAAATGLHDVIGGAEVIVTGEGRFDQTSFAGKVVGRILARARECGTHAVVVAGGVSVDSRAAAEGAGVATFSLTDIAGSTESAMAAPSAALIEAGRRAALATHG